jgi:hypothetical protein
MVHLVKSRLLIYTLVLTLVRERKNYQSQNYHERMFGEGLQPYVCQIVQTYVPRSSLV